MKWIEGLPGPAVVQAHHDSCPDSNPEYRGDPPFGMLTVHTVENLYEPNERLIEEKMQVPWPNRSGLWICHVPRELCTAATGARFQHLRVHPENGRVLYAIGFNEWGYLDRTIWGSISKWLPTTPEGLPVDYQAAG